MLVVGKAVGLVPDEPLTNIGMHACMQSECLRRVFGAKSPSLRHVHLHKVCVTQFPTKRS